MVGMHRSEATMQVIQSRSDKVPAHRLLTRDTFAWPVWSSDIVEAKVLIPWVWQQLQDTMRSESQQLLSWISFMFLAATAACVPSDERPRTASPPDTS